MFLIVGLGNPGKEYRGTRHNIGFDVVDKLGENYSIDINKIKFNSIYGEGKIGGEKIFLIKPTTFMNLSGQAVQQFASYYKVEPENIIIIADDIDIPFSSVRIKRNGSGGSHNGLKSIVNSLASKDFPRIKVGIGNKHPKQSLASFVLERFTKEEEIDMDNSANIAIKAIEEIIVSGIDSAMNKYNNRKGRAQD